MASKTKSGKKNANRDSTETNTSKTVAPVKLSEEKSGLYESWKAFIKWVIFGALLVL